MDEVMSRYTDDQALEDGMLVDISTCGLIAGDRRVDRITVNLWNELSTQLAFHKETQQEKDDFVLVLIKRMCQGWKSAWVEWTKTAPEDDDRIIQVKTALKQVIWAVENERGNYTLMLPEDY